MMCLILQGIRLQVQVLKLYKSVQESSEKENQVKKCWILKLDS